MYFLAAVAFDILRNSGYDWAIYGTTISLYFVFLTVGLLASVMYFCPESRTFRESLAKLRTRLSFILYEVILLIWIIFYLVAPERYLPTTFAMLGAILVFPTMLFLYTKRRAKPTHIKKTMRILSTSWFSFVTVDTLLFALGTQPPVLGITLPFAWQIAFITSSALFFAMSVALADQFGSTKLWTGQLVPETFVKPGHRYLILHDSGRRTVAFFSSTLRSLVESGARVIIKASRSNWLVGSWSQSDPHFGDWTKNGKIVFSDTREHDGSSKEGLSERLSLGPTAMIYVNELGPEDLQRTVAPLERDARERHQSLAELFLLESTKAPRPQLTEFLHRNGGIELLNLSESTEPFSSLVKLDHQSIHGSSIMLEYDTNSDYEGVVDKFLVEGISNAELCVLFTTKSSKLYRAIKGKRMIKIIAASSLISVPDELPDGEMQIPDKELGLVASIVSDFLDNSKSMGASFVFDSITELIRGERWEQIYSGIIQLIELLNVPDVTTVFLANRNTMEPRFLGALRSAFSVQMKLDNTGLHAVKVLRD